jgi:ABC-type bacteriocin/lantibiotic exporter with double-glycine peptidase domain
MIDPSGKELVDSLHVILKFYFGDVKKDTILAIAGAKEEEFDIQALLKVSKESNLFAQTGEVDINKIEKFLLPVILYNDKNEIIILEAVSKTKARFLHVAKKKILCCSKTKT